MTSPSAASHYAQLAPDYALLRGRQDQVRFVADVIAELGDVAQRLTLDIGCGPGRLLAELRAQTGIRPIGLDVTAGMAAEAPKALGAGEQVLVGQGEMLPFRDGTIERCTMIMVVHHLDRDRAFREVHRVLAPWGRVIVMTPDHWRQSPWMERYFPRWSAIEQERFPTADAVAESLKAADFSHVEVVPRSVERVHRREDALAQLRGRAYSTFTLMSDEEYLAGLAAAQAELPERVEFFLHLLFVVADR